MLLRGVGALIALAVVAEAGPKLRKKHSSAGSVASVPVNSVQTGNPSATIPSGILVWTRYNCAFPFVSL